MWCQDYLHKIHTHSFSFVSFAPLLAWSPCLSLWTQMHTCEQTHKQLSQKNLQELYSSALVQCNYLVSVLSWRPRRSRNPWQPYRSQFPVMPSRSHRTLLSLENRWEKRAHPANAIILIILISQCDILINISHQEENLHPRKQASCFLPLSSAFCLIMTHSKARAHVVYYPMVGSDGTVCVHGHCCLRNKISNVPNLTGSPFSPIGPAGPTLPGRPGWPIAPAGPAGPLSPVAPWKWREVEMWGEYVVWFTLWFNVMVTITDHHGNSLLLHIS